MKISEGRDFVERKLRRANAPKLRQGKNANDPAAYQLAATQLRILKVRTGVE